MISPTSLSTTDEGAGASPKVTDYSDTISRAKQAVQENQASKTADQDQRQRSQNSPVRAAVEAAQREFLTDEIKKKAIDAYLISQHDAIFARVKKECWEELKEAVKSDSWDAIWEETRMQMVHEVEWGLRKEMRDEIVAVLRQELMPSIIDELKEELRADPKKLEALDPVATVEAAQGEVDSNAGRACSGAEFEHDYIKIKEEVISDAGLDGDNDSNGSKRRFSRTDHAPSPEEESEAYKAGSSKRRATEQAFLSRAMGGDNFAALGDYAKYLDDDVQSKNHESGDDDGKAVSIIEVKDKGGHGYEEEEDQDEKSSKGDDNSVIDALRRIRAKRALEEYSDTNEDGDDEEEEEEAEEEQDLTGRGEHEFEPGVGDEEGGFTDNDDEAGNAQDYFVGGGDDAAYDEDEGDLEDYEVYEDDKQDYQAGGAIQQQRKASAPPAVIDLTSDDDD